MLSNEALYFLLDKIYDKEYEKYIEIGIVADDDSRIESYQKCIDFLIKHEVQLKKDASATNMEAIAYFNSKMDLFKERLEKKHPFEPRLG